MSQVEQPAYKVERSEGPIELRAYPPSIVAETRVHGARKSAINQGFRVLAGYIFGANGGSQNIEMTAPVMQERSSDPLPETADLSTGEWAVRFIMPRSWTLQTLPKPKDERVTLTQMPAATFAVIRFSGFARDAVIEAKSKDLFAFIEANKLGPTGAPIFAFYNPPWTLPIFRRNEIMIQIKPPATLRIEMPGIENAIRTALLDAFEAHDDDQRLSEQALAAEARSVLTRDVPGVIFNDITAHRDENGRVRKIEVDYMDKVHDPAPRSVAVEFE